MLNSRFCRRLILSLSLVAPVACKHNAEAKLESVSLPVTLTQNQGSSGFCWAYVTAAYLEQQQLATGLSAEPMSAEYFGLWHLVDQLMLGQPADDGELVGNALKFLIPAHGAVPQSAFHVRFESSRDKLAPLVQRAADAFLAANHRADKRLAKSEALTLVKQALQLNVDLPDTDTTFSVGGQTYTPLTFASDRLHFNSADYVTLNLADASLAPDVYEQQMQLVKKALLLGHAVPMSLSLFDLPKDGSDWRCGACGASSLHAFHVVLVVDYQSASSAFGFQETAALEAAFAEPVTAWLAKNSFGMGIFRGSSTRPEVLARDAFPAFSVIGADYARAGSHFAQLQVVIPASVLGASQSDQPPYDLAVDWSQLPNAKLPTPTAKPASYSADPSLAKTGPVTLVNRPGGLDPTAAFARNGATYPLGADGSPAFVCLAFAVSSPAVKAVAIYRPQLSTSPYMVVQASSDWETCIQEGLGFHKLVAQALDESQQVLQVLPIGFTVVAGATAAVAATPTPPPAASPVTQAAFSAARGGLGDSADTPE